MQVPIEDIMVKKRIRGDMGDIGALAESMKRFGLICPIVLSEKNVLIAGGRRLQAARSLGWRTINAVIVQIPRELSPLEFEVEENVRRQDFTPDEKAKADKKIFLLKNPGIFRRIWNALVRFFKRLFKVED
ncbi:MAG: ParB N-terminal domain-containing protein [Spirochaetaceae bacterium]|jgi:ParB family chromosome partitioning protein|nr:ParB N-terminal domain-containing protein [Spirochaetaceae bacterium]